MKGTNLLAFLLGALMASSEGKKLGERCLLDMECQLDLPGIYSECYVYDIWAGECRCKWTDNDSGNRCIKPPEKLGEYCEVERHCHYNLGPLSRCPGHKCTCTHGSSPNENGTLCVPNKNVGEVCTIDAECPSVGGYGGCIVVDPSALRPHHKNCVCHSGSVPNEDNTECLQFRRLQQECETTPQCQISGCGDLCYCGDTTSSGKRCLCEDGYISDQGSPENKCVKIRERLGEECSYWRQCRLTIGTMSDCVDGKCACMEGSIPNFENNFCDKVNQTTASF